MNVAALLQDSPSEDRRRIPQQQQQQQPPPPLPPPPASPQWRESQNQTSWQDQRATIARSMHTPIHPSSSPPSSSAAPPPVSSPRTPSHNTTALPPPSAVLSGPSPGLGPSWGLNHVHPQMGDARHLMGSGHNVVLVGGGQRSIMHPMDRERERERDRDRERMRRTSNASNTATTTTPASNTNTLVGPGTGAAPSFMSLGSSSFHRFCYV